MNANEKIAKLFAFADDARPGFWTGNPHAETFELYSQQLGVETGEELFEHFNDDCRWIPAGFGGYNHPEGKPIFDYRGGREAASLGDPGVLGQAESVADVEAIDWPDPKYFDFSPVIENVRAHRQHFVFTGLWSPFFHDLHFFFGMENYFIKMFTHPEVVEAATERIVDFYIAAGERFFTELGDAGDVFFFGNDFGSQLDVLCGPEQFQRFVLPSFRRLIDLGHRHGKPVMLHSCGSIHKVLPWLVEAGTDALHPLQARAAGMDAESLARDYKGKIVFCGGVDTQDLLIHATPEQVKDEVRRLKDLLGPHCIVSPSHEALLPNVPLANVEAMAAAAHEG